MAGDLIFSAAGGLSVYLIFFAVKSRNLTYSKTMLTGLRAARAEHVATADRRPWLKGPADAFGQTGPGRRLAAYAATNHPSMPYAEVVTIGLAAILAGGLAGVILFPAGPLPLLSALFGPVIADRVLIRLSGVRSGRLEKQLPEALALQAAALRAGNSLTQSLRLVGADLKAKSGLADELARTLAEVDLGASLDQALIHLSGRSGSVDVELWVTAMLVHRVTGGNLASIIDSLSGRIRDRLNLKGEIKAMTAQGRMSGLVVALAPIAFLLILSATSRRQMEMLYKTPAGWALLALGMTMDALGFLWIRWILRIKI